MLAANSGDVLLAALSSNLISPSEKFGGLEVVGIRKSLFVSSVEMVILWSLSGIADD